MVVDGECIEGAIEVVIEEVEEVIVPTERAEGKLTPNHMLICLCLNDFVEVEGADFD